MDQPQIIKKLQKQIKNSENKYNKLYTEYYKLKHPVKIVVSNSDDKLINLYDFYKK